MLDGSPEPIAPVSRTPPAVADRDHGRLICPNCKQDNIRKSFEHATANIVRTACKFPQRKALRIVVDASQRQFDLVEQLVAQAALFVIIPCGSLDGFSPRFRQDSQHYLPFPALRFASPSRISRIALA